MPRLIDAYLSEFDRHLAFDRRRARRVRAEVGSHLAEALEHETSEAEAVARFGDSKQLAKAFVESALPRRLQFAALSLVIMAAMTLAMMRLRSVWFDLSAYQHGFQTILQRLIVSDFCLDLRWPDMPGGLFAGLTCMPNALSSQSTVRCSRSSYRLSRAWRVRC